MFQRINLYSKTFSPNVLQIQQGFVDANGVMIYYEEFDGPMLQHGLKELNGNKIFVPTKKIEKPNPDFLDIRYQRFRRAS